MSDQMGVRLLFLLVTWVLFFSSKALHGFSPLVLTATTKEKYLSLFKLPRTQSLDQMLARTCLWESEPRSRREGAERVR
jgi:hypothetical protein